MKWESPWRETMKSLEELAEIRRKNLPKVDIRTKVADKQIVVSMATCGIAAGARPVLEAFVNEISSKGLEDVVVLQNGDTDMCDLEPVVNVYMPNEERVTYVKVTPDIVSRIITEHVQNGNVVTEYTLGHHNA